MDTYNFSDYDKQKEIILPMMDMINMSRKMQGELPIPLGPILKKMWKRILRHNGLDNKYLGNGKLRGLESESNSTDS